MSDSTLNRATASQPARAERWNRAAGRRGWAVGGSSHFVPAPWTAPRPARTHSASVPPEKPGTGPSLASGRRMSKNRKPRDARWAGNHETLRLRRAQGGEPTRLRGGACVPAPPPDATFAKTDTRSARARGGARGLPRRVPWRPRLPSRRARQRAPQRRPPTAPGPSVGLGTPHARRAVVPRVARLTRGRLCKFPLGLSFSKGHSRLRGQNAWFPRVRPAHPLKTGGTECLVSKGPAGPPPQDWVAECLLFQGSGRPTQDRVTECLV